MCVIIHLELIILIIFPLIDLRILLILGRLIDLRTMIICVVYFVDLVILVIFEMDKFFLLNWFLNKLL